MDVKNKIITFPNLLSVVRILFSPIFVWLLVSEFYIAAILIFTVAALTDAYDGYMARKNEIITSTGMFLDPLADKVLILSAFSVFAYLKYISWLTVFMIFFRDIFVTVLRIKLLQYGTMLKTSRLAKYKTALQFGTIYLLFFDLYLHQITKLENLFYIDLFVTVVVQGLTVFVVYTCVDYLIQYMKVTLKNEDK